MPAMVGTPAVPADAGRAPRFSLVMRVRIRTGAGEWVEGTTVNIGGTGLLLRSAQAAALSSRLEFQVALCATRSWDGPYVACTGCVVRANTLAASAGTEMALSIESFELRPARAGDECTPAGPPGSCEGP